MALDWGAFDNAKTLIDYQQIADAFRAKQTQEGLQAIALAKQASRAISPLEMLKINMLMQENQSKQADRVADNEWRAQNAVEDRAMRVMLAQQGIDARMQGIQDKRDAEKVKREEKIDIQRREDLAGLNGALSGLDQQISKAEQLFGSVDEKGNIVQKPMDGLESNFGLSSYVPNVAGSKASDAKANLDSIRSGTFLGGLATLKSQSATGSSGLGPVSNIEGEKVQNATAALQKEQSYPNLLRNGRDYVNTLKKSRQNLLDAYKTKYGSGVSVPQVDLSQQAPVMGNVPMPSGNKDFSGLW